MENKTTLNRGWVLVRGNVEGKGSFVIHSFKTANFIQPPMSVWCLPSENIIQILLAANITIK